MNSMKSQVIELVQNTVRKYSSTKSPNFGEICSGLRLDVMEGVLPDGIDGMHSGNKIIINSQIQNEERKRFTQFHEVAHYLIEENGDLISELRKYTCSQEDGYKRSLEVLCNIGAAEFLMPREEFRKLYKAKGFNVELILYAAHHFRSSSIATTIQLAQVAPNECIAVVCENGLIPNGSAPSQASFFTTGNQYHNKSRLHVIYSASSPAASDRWLAKNTVIPDDHLINQGFLKAEMLEAESYIPFPTWQESCFCEVLPYKNRVYALFHLSPLPDPNQMALF